VHSFEYGAAVELRHWQWSRNWSHFVPFCLDGETFYIAYKYVEGRLYLVNAKTAHTYIDFVTIKVQPGYTHIVHLATKEGNFAILYNSTSSELHISKIDVGKTKSAFLPHHTTTLPPGNFTHLIGCEEKLIAYSAATGDVSIFHIGKSAKKVALVGTHPIEKNLAVLSPLTSSQPKRAKFFAYSALTGDAWVCSLSEDAQGSHFTIYKGLDVGLTCVVPLKIGTFEYVAAYQHTTGLLKFLKFGPNSTLVPFSTHTIPSSLTSLIFLERQP